MQRFHERALAGSGGLFQILSGTESLPRTGQYDYAHGVVFGYLPERILQFKCDPVSSRVVYVGTVQHDCRDRTLDVIGQKFEIGHGSMD